MNDNIGGFWPTRENFHFFSKSYLGQWSRRPFTDEEGVLYFTAEHYMMAQKAKLFSDFEAYNAILMNSSPKSAKETGRRVKGFEQDVWDANCEQIVIHGNYLRFKAYPEEATLLMFTYPAILVESSTVDLIWGNGLKEGDPRQWDRKNWPGLNKLGFCLTKVRDILINE